MEVESVLCADCGFLAMRKLASRELVEAEDDMRKRGSSAPAHGNLPIYEDSPICFAGAIDIREQTGDQNPLNRAAVIKFPRGCKSFTPWHRGLTPREHQEMLDRQWQTKHDEDREKSDRTWKEQQAAEARTSANRSLTVAILGIIVAASINVAGLFFKSPPPPINVNVPPAQVVTAPAAPTSPATLPPK